MDPIRPQAISAAGSPTRSAAPAAASTAPSMPTDARGPSVPPPMVDAKKAAAIVLGKGMTGSEVTKLWEAPGTVTGSPVRGSDGTIFVGHPYKGMVAAYHPETGDMRWHFDFGDSHRAAAPMLSPDGKALLAACEGGDLLALDPQSGLELFKVPVPGGYRHRMQVGADGKVYLSGQGVLLKVDLARRAVVQETPLRHGFESSPVVGADGTIYGGGHDGNIYALEPGEGTVKWTCPTGDMVRNSPTVGPDGTVYGGCIGKSLVAVDPATGKEKWHFDTPHWIIPDPAVGPDGTVYVGCSNNFVYALDPADGHRKWEFEANGEIRVSPVPSKDHVVYVVSDRNVVFGLDEMTGKKLWSTPAASYVHCPPCVDDRGGFVFGANNDHFYAMRDPETARRVVLGESALQAATRPEKEDETAEAPSRPGVEIGEGWIVVGGVKVPVRSAP